ncbi:MAG: DnaB-like helicase N-terminal domain-containing protein [Bilophila wadsworthia]
MKTEFETATTDLARRVPPHSVEAERAVLAGLILRPSAMGQIAPMLHPEDFYLPAHQTLYAAALGLHTDNRPVDLVTSDIARSRLAGTGGRRGLYRGSGAVACQRGKRRVLCQARTRQIHPARAHRGGG